MDNKEYINFKLEGEKIFGNKKEHDSKMEQLLYEKYDEIKNFPYKKIEDIEKYQLKRISYLVDYAYKNIPLYKEKYDKIGYKLGSIKTWNDYDKLPFLTKEELINGFPNKIVKNICDLNLSTRSSGSSGKFVTLAVSESAIYIDTLQGIRQYFLQSKTYEKKDTVLFIYTCPWWIKDINGLYNTEFLPTTASINEAIEAIIKFKPKIVSTYPTYLEKLSEKNIKLSEYGVETVIVHSEQSQKNIRKLLGEKLDVKVLDEYSSEELTRIALECHEGIYHIEEDACYIESYDIEYNKKVGYGKPGVLVGTNLLNTATPIIKYIQGDVVIVDKPIRCKCGNNSRTIKTIHGRKMDSVITPQNDVIPASAFMDIAYNWFLDFDIPVHGLKYQFVQYDNKSLNLYLIVDKFEIDLQQIKKSIYLLIPEDMIVNIEIVKKLPNIKSKYRPLINLIKGGK